MARQNNRRGTDSRTRADVIDDLKKTKVDPNHPIASTQRRAKELAIDVLTSIESQSTDTPTCSEPGCDAGPPYSKGKCKKHYIADWRRNRRATP